MTNHHPDTRLLNEFSSGALPLAQSACVSIHLDYCEQCQRSHQRLQQLGGALFEDLSPQQVDDSLLRAVMSRLDEEPVPLSYSNRSADENSYPALLQRLMDCDFDSLEWRRINADLRIGRLRTGDKENELALYHIKAGGSIPKHSHRGTELTLVLKGSFSDEDGEYHRGDFLMRDAAHVHTPTAAQSGDCICVGVLDAPVQFKSWHYRMLNPFLKLHAH